MKLADYIDDLKLELTGGVMKLEIPDEAIARIFSKALRELNRYINETQLVTIPFTKCIDLKDLKCSSVSNVYRATSAGETSGVSNLDGGISQELNIGVSSADPMYAQQWAMFGGGPADISRFNEWTLNYTSFNTVQQIQNTISTDLTFKHDKHNDKLYINVVDVPSYITIEYVPIFEDVDEVRSEYWQDVLLRLAVALTKVVLGRIRSKYTHSSALWTVDGSTMLQEGSEELNRIRESLVTNSQITYTLD